MTSLTSINKSEEKNKKKRDHITGRFILLAVVLVGMLLMIMVRTIQLQVSDTSVAGILETIGNRRQMVVPAARGDIVDINGVPLAFSVQTRALYLANSGVSETQLNRALFDLSNLILEDGVVYKSRLSDYFGLSQASQENDLLDAQFVFKKDRDDILAWQTNRDLFNLVDPAKATASQRNRMAKLDPAELFDYLLYDVFDIESREAGGSRRFTDREAYRIMELRYTLLENNWLYTSGTPILLVDDISDRVEQIINDQSYRYPGVVIENHYSRRYSAYADYASHAIGYIGAISGSEYESLKRFDYGLDTMIGKSGVELSAERYLRGIDGIRPYLMFVEDNTQTSQEGGRLPQHGAEVRLTLDSNLQQLTVEAVSELTEALRGLPLAKAITAKSASWVVMDPQTGGIMAIGSLPDYKVSDFVNQAADPSAAERVNQYLTDNETKPMLNRAISENYAPASTFKPITSLAALESGSVSRFNTSFECIGTEEIGGWVWRCLQYPQQGHGVINLVEGLTTSCNMYFYHMGMETGIDNISHYAKELGLGELSGIDLPGEVAGLRPSREMKELLRTLPEDKTWFQADTCQTSIGQFDNSYTMLQMVRAISGLATNQLVRPHIISEIIDSNGVTLREEQIERIPLEYDSENLALIRAGMVNMTRNGTGRTNLLFGDFPVNVAAKTGTAEIGYGANETVNAVFVAYAPAENPEIAIAFMVEDASFGELISEVAYKVFCEYFGVTPKDIPPISPINVSNG